MRVIYDEKMIRGERIVFCHFAEFRAVVYQLFEQLMASGILEQLTSELLQIGRRKAMAENQVEQNLTAPEIPSPTPPPDDISGATKNPAQTSIGEKIGRVSETIFGKFKVGRGWPRKDGAPKISDVSLEPVPSLPHRLRRKLLNCPQLLRLWSLKAVEFQNDSADQRSRHQSYQKN